MVQGECVPSAEVQTVREHLGIEFVPRRSFLMREFVGLRSIGCFSSPEASVFEAGSGDVSSR